MTETVAQQALGVVIGRKRRDGRGYGFTPYVSFSRLKPCAAP